MSDEAVYAALLREDLYAFIRKVFFTLNGRVAFKDNWHIRVMAYELQRVGMGLEPRLILNVPPRSLKSIAASVALVAWYLGHNPGAEVICASYGADLSLQFATDCRTIMKSRWYQAIFPTRISNARGAVMDFRTIQGGGRLATSVGGPMTGRGADLVVIDDPAKPDEMLSQSVREGTNRWIHSTVHSRLNDKSDCRIVVAMQRLHVMDLTGYLMASGTWRCLKLAAVAPTDEKYVIEDFIGRKVVFRRKEGEALHPARESLASLKATAQDLGSYYYAAQYLQTPMMADGNIVKIAWFSRYDTAPETFDSILQSWDTASKVGELNSFSVCTTWGVKGKNVYLLHVLRKRMEYPELKRAVVQQRDLYRPSTILVEDKSSGMALLQELHNDGIHNLKAVKPEGTKEMRMSNQTALIEGGFVHLPKDAPWLKDYEEELMLFPIGAHADQVDSTSQALAHFQKPNMFDGMLEYMRMEVEEMRRDGRLPPA